MQPDHIHVDYQDNHKKGLPRTKRRRSLATELTAVLVVMVSVVSFLVFGVSYKIFSLREEGRIASLTRDLACSLAQSISIPLWTLDSETLSAIAASYYKNPIVSNIRIEERWLKPDNGKWQNRVLFDWKKTTVQAKFSERALVVYGNKTIGEVTVGTTDRPYKAALTQFLWISLLTVALVIITMVFMIYLLMSRRLKRPLDRIIEGMDNISRGNYGIRIRTPRHKELVTITEKFVEMASRLRAREASYSALNARLVEEVKERERSESQVKSKETLLRAIISSSPDGIFAASDSGKILAWNPCFLRMWNIPPDISVSSDTTRLFPIMESQLKDSSVLESLIVAASEGMGIIEVSFKNGSVFSCSYAPIKIDDNNKGFVWTFRDTTNQKRTLDALRESETRFRQLSEAALEGIVITDAGVVLLANTRYLRMFGYEHAEVIGNPFFFKSRSPHPMSIPEEKNENNGFFEAEGIKKDGRKFPIVIRKRSMIYFGKRVEVFIIRDITERKEAEKERYELLKKLAAAQKMEALGLLAGGVAHDLNNILSGISSYPELLLMKGGLNDKTRRALEIIRDSGKRAAEVVNDLTTIARGIACQKEPLKLDSVVEHYFSSPEFHQLEMRFPSVRLELEIEPGLPLLKGSRIHIEKSLMNLVANAYEAIESEGTVRVELRTVFPEESVRKRLKLQPIEYICLSVSDDGPGIPSQDIDRIFEPFYTKKVMGRSGTGLGLCVVWNMVQDHDAAIDVKSGPEGTRFDIYFKPTSAQLIERVGDTGAKKKYAGAGERILVVDDEEAQREISTQILTFLGYRVEAVASGSEAVAYLRKHDVELVILDMIMPNGMGGKETFEAIKSFKPAQKFVIVSGYSVTEDVASMQRQGAARFIKKPYSVEVLAEAIWKTLHD